MDKLRTFEGFTQQLEGTARHEIAGLLESFYIRIKGTEKDTFMLQMASDLLGHWAPNTGKSEAKVEQMAAILSETAQKIWNEPAKELQSNPTTPDISSIQVATKEQIGSVLFQNPQSELPNTGSA